MIAIVKNNNAYILIISTVYFQDNNNKRFLIDENPVRKVGNINGFELRLEDSQIFSPILWSNMNCLDVGHCFRKRQPIHVQYMLGLS